MTSVISSGSISRAKRFRPSASAILFNPFSVSFHDGLFASLRDCDVCLKEVSDRAGSRVVGDLDAATLLDHVGVVAFEHFTRLSERHRWVVAELGFRAFPVSPLLRHPLRGHARWHRTLRQERDGLCLDPHHRLGSPAFHPISTRLMAWRMAPSVRLGTRVSPRISGGGGSRVTSGLQLGSVSPPIPSKQPQCAEISLPQQGLKAQ